MAKDPIELVTPLRLAATVFDTKEPSESQLVSARRALRRLAKQKKVVDCGVDRKTRQSLYGGQVAVIAHFRQVYARQVRPV